jgi:sugar phosphate isomerase/epimerase
MMNRRLTYQVMLVFIATGLAAFAGKDDIKIASAVTWKTGVALYSFNHHSLDSALHLAQLSGVKSVEGFSFYNLGLDFGNRSMGHLDAAGLALLKKKLKESGLVMSSMYVGDADNEQDWKKYFELGRELKLKYLVCEPRRELLSMIDSLAGQYKIKIAIHQHVKGTSNYWHPDSVLTAIKGQRNIGACADLGHWIRSGLDPVKCLQILSGHVIGIHLKDVDSAGNDVKLGTGAIDFPGVINELKRQKFEGVINVECEHDMDDNLSEVKYALDYFNKLAFKKNKIL